MKWMENSEFTPAPNPRSLPSLHSLPSFLYNSFFSLTYFHQELQYVSVTCLHLYYVPSRPSCTFPHGPSLPLTSTTSHARHLPSWSSPSLMPFTFPSRPYLNHHSLKIRRRVTKFNTNSTGGENEGKRKRETEG